MNRYAGTIVLLAFLLATLGTASGCIRTMDTAGTGFPLQNDTPPVPAQESAVVNLTGNQPDYSAASENESMPVNEVPQESSSTMGTLVNYSLNESLIIPADGPGNANLSEDLSNDSLNESLIISADESGNANLSEDLSNDSLNESLIIPANGPGNANLSGDLSNDSSNESLTYQEEGSANLTLTGDQETSLRLEVIRFLPSTPPISSQFTFPLNGTLSAGVSGLSSRQVEYAWDIDGDDYPEYTSENPDHSYGAPGEYEVTLTVIDTTSGRNATRTDLLWVPEYLVPLHPGWNFISVPRELAPYAILGKIMDLNLTGNHPVLGYQPLTGWEPLDGGTRVRPLDGIWIYSTEESELSLIFNTDPAHLPPVKELFSGWNAIGFTDIAPAPANETLSSLGDLWTSCTGYNASTQSYDSSILRDSKGASNDSGLLRPGQGYWVYVSGNGTLAAIGA